MMSKKQHKYVSSSFADFFFDKFIYYRIFNVLKFFINNLIKFFSKWHFLEFTITKIWSIVIL